MDPNRSNCVHLHKDISIERSFYDVFLMVIYLPFDAADGSHLWSGAGRDSEHVLNLPRACAMSFAGRVRR